MNLPLPRIRRTGALALAVAAMLLGGSIGTSAQPDDGDTAMTRLSVGLGFIPNVQFAQFYLADEAGYYDAAGLDVTFQYTFDRDLITLLAQGAVDIGMADGTSLVPAVSQGVPVVFGASIYARGPNVVFSLADSGIEAIADLEGKRVGIPGLYGSSWVGLQALLSAAGLTADDVDLVTYPEFGQGVAVAEAQVDAATGFVTNEPVQLRLQGLDVNELHVFDVAPLPGPGLVTGLGTLETRGDALRAFTAATLRAMDEIAADPQLGLDATFATVPELANDPETQLAILEATIGSWTSDHTAELGFGSIDRTAWESSLEIMQSLPDFAATEDVTVDDLVTDDLLPPR